MYDLSKEHVPAGPHKMRQPRAPRKPVEQQTTTGPQEKELGRLSRIPAALIAGLICGLLAVMFSISSAALLFSSVLNEYFVVGIGVCVFGTIVLNSFIALFSSCPGMVSVTQEVTVVTLAVIATSIHTAMFAAHSEAEILATIVVMIGLATTITGLALLTIGTLRWGRFIRFVPFPVTAGFLAGMGWLIVAGAMAVILDSPLDQVSVSSLIAPANVAKWLPAAVFAVVVCAIARQNRSPLVLPLAVLAFLIVFQFVVASLGVSVEELRQLGWLFTPPQEGRVFIPLQSNPLAAADWGVIWSETPKIIALVAITASALLFAASGIEVSLKRDVDLDRELRVAGIANVLTGAGGGAAGFQGLGLTLLAHQLGAPFRIVGLLVAAVCIATLYFGTALLSFVPVPLFGGLLLWIGGSLVYHWLIAIRAQVSWFEQSIVLLVLIVIVTIGLIEGVLAGFFVIATRFMLDFARVEVIKHETAIEIDHDLNGKTSDSSSSDPIQKVAILTLSLQGYIFFGNVYRLHSHILKRFSEARAEPIRFIILNFQDVVGTDASGKMSLKKMREIVEERNGRLIICGLEKMNLDQKLYLTRRDDSGEIVDYFINATDALEWCKDCISLDLDDRSKSSRK